jgi:hypothetical protein
VIPASTQRRPRRPQKLPIDHQLSRNRTLFAPAQDVVEIVGARDRPMQVPLARRRLGETGIVGLNECRKKCVRSLNGTNTSQPQLLHQPVLQRMMGPFRAALSLAGICVIGVSGTGSIVAEHLARLGVGSCLPLFSSPTCSRRWRGWKCCELFSKLEYYDFESEISQRFNCTPVTHRRFRIYPAIRFLNTGSAEVVQRKIRIKNALAHPCDEVARPK